MKSENVLVAIFASNVDDDLIMTTNFSYFYINLGNGLVQKIGYEVNTYYPSSICNFSN